MPSVFISSTGAYSDWSIRGVFSTRELAEDYQRRCNTEIPKDEQYFGSFNDIEEHILDLPLTRADQGLRMFYFSMDRDGNVRSVPTSRHALDIGSEIGSEVTRAMWWNPRQGTYQWMNVSIWALDETHALKIANEKRLMIEARNGWGNDEILAEVFHG